VAPVLNPPDKKTDHMKRRRYRTVYDHIHQPTHPHLHSDPTGADRRINPDVQVRRDEDGSFIVLGVLRGEGGYTHFLSTECPHCPKKLQIAATGPSEMPAYAREEACRLAVLEHLRTDPDHVKR
jgi:hypothetical protein